MMQIRMPLAGETHTQARSFRREGARREGALGAVLRIP